MIWLLGCGIGVSLDIVADGDEVEWKWGKLVVPIEAKPAASFAESYSDATVKRVALVGGEKLPVARDRPEWSLEIVGRDIEELLKLIVLALDLPQRRVVPICHRVESAGQRPDLALAVDHGARVVPIARHLASDGGQSPQGLDEA